jgi:hypothetical protein
LAERLRGEDAEDFRAGVVASTMHNMWRAENTPARSPLDYFPWHDKPKPNAAPRLGHRHRGRVEQHRT